MYSQQDFQQAQLISAGQYLALKDPKFEGQTRLDNNGEYKMYWSCDGKLFYTEAKLITEYV